MSVEALVWAFSTPIKPASAKLTMIALADSANHAQEAWPCIETLAAKTSLDRKTVIASLDALESAGLLADTGKRVGSTRQVKVYRIVGLDSGDRHYTYRIDDEETGEFYIGVRSCYWDAEKDSAYMGSGKWALTAVRSGRPLRKTILGVYATRAEAEVAEMTAIRTHAGNPLCRNVKGTKTGTVPKPEQFRFSQETVPFLGHVTQSNPKKRNNKEERARVRVDPVHDGLVVDDKLIEEWSAAFPAIDVAVEVKRAEMWLKANPANRKSNYERFLFNWLTRAQDRAPRIAAAPMPYSATRRTAAPAMSKEERDAEAMRLLGFADTTVIDAEGP